MKEPATSDIHTYGLIAVTMVLILMAFAQSLAINSEELNGLAELSVFGIVAP